MYGTDSRLLSCIPIHEIGTIKKGDAEKEVQKSNSNSGKPLETMPFRKHKNQKLSDIPKEYWEWMIKSFNWHDANINLKQAIEGSL